MLGPTPDSPLDFSYADRLFARAERHGQPAFAAHLVWDEGLGEGWTDDDLWGSVSARRAGCCPAPREPCWSATGAGWPAGSPPTVTDPEGRRGVRTNVSWYETIGPDHISEMFALAEEVDPAATRVLNEFGFETATSGATASTTGRRRRCRSSTC